MNEIIVVNQDGRPVALKVVSITPDPLGTDIKRKLLEHCSQSRGASRARSDRKKRLTGVSRDGARYARKDIRAAIERLQAFDHTLTEHIG